MSLSLVHPGDHCSYLAIIPAINYYSGNSGSACCWYFSKFNCILSNSASCGKRERERETSELSDKRRYSYRYRWRYRASARLGLSRPSTTTTTSGRQLNLMANHIICFPNTSTTTQKFKSRKQFCELFGGQSSSKLAQPVCSSFPLPTPSISYPALPG